LFDGQVGAQQCKVGIREHLRIERRTKSGDERKDRVKCTDATEANRVLFPKFTSDLLESSSPQKGEGWKGVRFSLTEHDESWSDYDVPDIRLRIAPGPLQMRRTSTVFSQKSSWKVEPGVFVGSPIKGWGLGRGNQPVKQAAESIPPKLAFPLTLFPVITAPLWPDTPIAYYVGT
jgi:hypothetical protein